MENVKNVMEDIVKIYFESTLNEFSAICKCEKCRSDIYALTLNKLKPIYAVTDEGKVYVKAKMLADQCKADILSSISAAVFKVSENKHHD